MGSGRLGSDAFGAQLRAHLDRCGVDTAGVQTSEGSSGVAVIVVSHDGENSIVVSPAANQKLTPHDLETNLQKIREAGLVLTQLETPVETVECLAQICARERVPLILDPAPPDLAAVAERDAEQRHGVVLKMGEKGAYVASRDGLAEVVPAIAVSVVDTTATGDAFNGGFATALMSGKTPAESASSAAVVGRALGHAQRRAIFHA